MKSKQLLNRLNTRFNVLKKQSKEIPLLLLIISQLPGDEPIPSEKHKNYCGCVLGIIHVPLDASEEELQKRIDDWHLMPVKEEK